MGLPADDARRQARLAFGGVEQVKEAARDVRGLIWLDSISQDMYYAARGLRRSPGFTAAVVLTIALGLGANAALFGVIDRLMFRPPAYLHEPSQVNRVYWYALLAGRSDIPRPQASRTRFDNIARATHSFDAITGFYDEPVPVGAGADKADRTVSAVTGNFFTFFDARPAQGRFIGAADESVPAGAPVAVISYSMWRDGFGSRAGVVGTTLQVGPVVRTIVGVAPDGFVGITDGPAPDLWVPADSRSFLTMVVRRKQGVSESAASAALTYALLKSWELERAVQPRMQPIEVARPRAAAVSLFPMRRPEAGPEAGLIPWLAGVGLIVLMIACANVANLLLARALRRRREITVRLALGVSRARLLMQLLTESLMLAMLGGAAGILLAHWGAEVLRTLLMPAGADANVVADGRTLLFASCAVLAVGIVSGLAPAAQALRQDLAGSLKSGVREGSYQRSRTRSTLLVMQVALSTILLIGAGLFEQSMVHLRTHGLGYDVDPVLTATISAHGTALNDTAFSLLMRRLEAEATTIPGVIHVAHGTTFSRFIGEFQPLMASGGDEVNWGLFRLQGVGPDFFAALGIRVLRGRAIEENDRKTAPLVAMVSQTSARALWPGQDAIGKCLRVGLGTKGITNDKIYIAPDTAPCRTVVGIAEDIKHESFVNDPGLQRNTAISSFA
jgi:predicted permease